MVKVRLWGTPEEVKAMKEYLKSLLQLHVTYCSEPCSDRGESVYQRVYMEIQLKELENK